MELKELLRKRAQLVEQARGIDKKAEAEARAKTSEERSEWERVVKEAEALSDQIAERQRLDALAGVADSNGDYRGDLLPHQERKNLGKYSVLRAINIAAGLRAVDGLEGEVSKELENRRGKPVRGNGFVMPIDLAVDLRSASEGRALFGTREKRAFDTTAGAGGIPTIVDTTYIDLLRNKLVCRQAGARVLSDMNGNFAIPRRTTAATAQWVAEGGAPVASSTITDQVPFAPRTVAALTDITRRLALQLNVDAEMFVREDLAAVMALALDLAGLNGTGNNNQPLGILQNPSISVTAIGANGGDPTWEVLVDMETAVANANADVGALGYVTNTATRGKLKKTAKIGSTFPIFLWENGPNPINGYPAFVSNQVPSNLTKGSSSGVCSAITFGNWADLIFALWSGMDIIVDPYTGSSSGTLRLVTLQDADVNVRHPESFNNCVDVTTS